MIPNDTILIFQEQTGFGNNFERKPSSISSKWFLHFFFWWKMKKENSDSVQQFSRIIQSNGGTIIIQDDPDLERWKKDHFFPLYSEDYKLVFCQTESFEILEWMIQEPFPFFWALKFRYLLIPEGQVQQFWLLLDEVVCFGCHWRPIFLPLRIHSIHHAFRINRTTHPIYSLFVFLCKVQGKNRHTAVKISHTTTYRDVIYKWEVKRLRLR